MSQAGSLSTTGAGGAIDTLTGDIGAAVGPDGVNNIDIVGGVGVTVTGNPGTNTLTIDSAGGGLNWFEIVGVGPTAMQVSTGYIANTVNPNLCLFTLPAVAAIGDVVTVVGKGTGLFQVQQGAGQQIHFGNVSTTAGAGGTLTSTHARDTILLVCVTANTEWSVLSNVGILTLV